MKLKDLIEKIANKKTTVMGFITLIVSVLAGLNVIGADAGTELATGIDLLYGNVVELLGAISGIILIFSKDTLVSAE
ncbi:MAG: hypothetical protein ACYTFW_24020 [Planctomycetota bacterium]|jgi:hypothetical protein